ncbi:MAG: ComEC/Rec2 family competence protein [Synergistaceae bacterium]|jgi:competence protein ComEC|nr:ComEC/Rec2 family competence protein [Synergistaceae bacterium]
MTLPAPNSPFLPRTPLGRAPAFALLACYSLLLVFMEEMNFSLAASSLLALTASAGWFLMGSEYPARSSIPVACVLFLAAAAGSVLIGARISSESAVPKSVDAAGVVLSDMKWGYARVALVRVNSSGVFRRGGKYVIKYRGRSDIEPGVVVRFSGRTERFGRADGPGEFDEFLYWKAKGASFAVVSPKIEITGRQDGIASWRAALGRRIMRSLPKRTAGYIAASWTGERDAALTDFHRNAGTSHLLAVSGLHVGIVFAVCWFFLKRLRFRLYIISVLIWLYTLLSGCAPSSLRAALMIQTAILGRLLGQPGCQFNGACAAGAFMLLYNPWIFWDIGWRLSIMSVLALTSLYSLELGTTSKNLLASPAVWLVTSVQASWTFGEIPAAGLVINFIAAPVFGILLPVASGLSIPALLGVKYLAYSAYLAEFFFAAWERFSNNITFLIPWKIDFSALLMISGVSVMLWMFSRSCGFSRSRAAITLCVGSLCLSFLVYIA